MAPPGKPVQLPLQVAMLGDVANVSVPSRVPSAQPSGWQVDEQPSPLTLLPSSHTSPSAAVMTPSPQNPGVQTPVWQ